MEERILERLMPATEVLDGLAREYDRRRLKGGWDECRRAAFEAVLPRLLHGQTIAWATACTMSCGGRSRGNDGFVFDPWNFIHEPYAAEVHRSFWLNFSNAPEDARSFDTLTGDFRFGFVDDEGRCCSGHAFSVFIDPRGLPAGAVTTQDGQVPNTPTPPAPELNKGGAPRQYDWERAIAAVVFAWADEGSWQPATKAEVKRKIADWFAAQDQHPSESLIKERASWLFEEFQQRGSGPIT